MIHLFTLLALLQDPVDWSGIAERKIEPVSRQTPGLHVPILRFAPEGDSLLSMNPDLLT